MSDERADLLHMELVEADASFETRMLRALSERPKPEEPPKIAQQSHDGEAVYLLIANKPWTGVNAVLVRVDAVCDVLIDQDGKVISEPLTFGLKYIDDSWYEWHLGALGYMRWTPDLGQVIPSGGLEIFSRRGCGTVELVEVDASGAARMRRRRFR